MIVGVVGNQEVSWRSRLRFLARGLHRFFQSSKVVAVYQSHIVLLSQRPRRGREEAVRLSLRNQANADLVLVPATVT